MNNCNVDELYVQRYGRDYYINEAKQASGTKKLKSPNGFESFQTIAEYNEEFNKADELERKQNEVKLSHDISKFLGL